MYTPTVTPYTPGNIDATTRMLIGLKQKGQLQQYVQQHSQDPNLVSLALFVNNLDNAVKLDRAAQTPKQPTVVNQTVAKMAPLPEDVGIGALSAPNMQQMADGGIAGYADGNLIAQNEPVVRMSGGGIVAFNGEKDSLVQSDAAYDPMTGLPVVDSSTYTSPDDRTLFERLGIFNPENRRALEKMERDLAQARESKTGAKAAAVPAKDTTATTAPVITPPAPTIKPPVMRPPVATPPAAPAPTSGLSALAAAQKMPVIDPVAQALAMGEKIYGTQETPLSIEERIARRDRFLGKSPLEEQLARLAKQDEAAKKEKANAASMSFFKAGLSMMNPPRTPGGKFAGLLAGVGKGAGEGLEDYQVAMKELKAADREREKMRMDIERGQYAEKAGKWDNAEAAYEKAAERQTKMKDHIMQAASTGYGELIRGQLNLQQAQLTGEYGLKREEMQGLNALRVAQITRDAALTAPERVAFTAELKRTGDPLKALTAVKGALAEAAREPVTREKAMIEWMKPGGAQMIQAQFPNIKTFDDYWSLLSGAATNTGGDFTLVGKRPG